MTVIQNDSFLRALRCETVERTPIWIMRQAGRYLPEYREVRAKAGDFMSLCKNTDFATEVTLQPLARFDLDAAILFSDILTIPDALGLELYFEAGEGPKFAKPLTTPRAIKNLPVLDPVEDLGYVMNAVSSIKRALKGSVPLIGFSGSPWTLACYMLQGEGSKDFGKAKSVLYGEPELMHQLLDHLTKSVTDYLLAQIEAGVDVVQIFDTWGGALSHAAYQEFSLAYMQKIVAGLIRHHDGRDVPVILFTKGGGLWLEAMADTGCHCLGLDWTMDIARARERVGDKVALQGNMDPAVLRADPAVIEQQVAAILRGFGQGSGHIFNLGHGITPDIDPEHVKVFIDAVHKFSGK